MHVATNVQDDVQNNPDSMVLMESGLRGIAQSALADIGVTLSESGFLGIQMSMIESWQCVMNLING